MIEQITATVPDPALCDTVLPRTSETGSLRRNAKGLHGVDDFIIEVRTAIKDQITGRGIERERLAQLLNNPRAGWTPGHVEVQSAPPVMRYDEEAVENPERERRHGKEIHRSDGFTMIPQESSTSLCRPRASRRFPHPSQHRSLRAVVAEHFELAMYARRPPGLILDDHSVNQFAHFPTHAFSSRTFSIS
jgi:hypothetical protein